MKKQLTFWSGIIGASLFAITSIVGGLQIEGYSPISQYISESYATGQPNSDFLRYTYIVSGLLLFLFGMLVASVFSKARGIKVAFILFAVFYGLGTLITGFFPCDLGCPTDGVSLSLSQFIHNISGSLTYCVVPLCLIGSGISFGKISNAKRLGKLSLLCGILALIFILLLFGNPTGPYIGLFQRVVEGSILFWIVYTAFYIKNVK